YWAAVGGADVPPLLERLVERVQLVHLKDGDLSADPAAQLPLGTGAMPLAEPLRAAADVAYGVIEFHDYAGDLFEGIEASTGPVGVGLIGAGTISAEYLTHLTSFPDLVVHIVGDLFPEAAAARAAEFRVPASGTAQDVLDHPDVEIVVNLTIPTAHAEVSRAIVAAGKHVWTEKPITTAPADAKALLAAAEEAGVRVGGAPDTVLGAGIQTALRTLRDGAIGAPASALTLFQ